MGTKKKTESGNGADPSERVAEFYSRTFASSPAGREILEKRGITGSELYSRHRAGYSDGSLARSLPHAGSLPSLLAGMGILIKAQGARFYTERFLKCAVIPVPGPDNGICGFQGISANSADDLFLAIGTRCPFNISTARSCPEIYLACSVSDALVLESGGIANVAGLCCIKDSMEEEFQLLADSGVGDVTLVSFGKVQAPSNFADFAKSAEGLFKYHELSFPKWPDAAVCVAELGATGLASLISREAGKIKGVKTSDISGGEGLFGVTLGGRSYELIGVEKKKRSLRATVRVRGNGKMHVDTLDFYISTMRQRLCRDISAMFAISPEMAGKEVDELMHLCEGGASTRSNGAGTGLNGGGQGAANGAGAPTISQAEKVEAEELGRSGDIFGRILSDYLACGLVGEENNKLLCYLAMTSRKMAEPLSVLMLSSSGAGKSALQDAALKFCPPEDLVRLTSISAKALFYKEKDSLKHKVLAFEEDAGADEASYAIRNLISSDRLVIEVAVRDGTGKLTTASNTVEGPVSVFCTTTNPEVDPETRSRFLVTGIDESREQTRRILEFQKQRRGAGGLQVNLEREKVIAVHRNFQRLLKPLAVVNPHVGKLSYSDDRLQGRRAQPQYLNIIGAVAFLRQFQKEIKNLKKNSAPSVSPRENIEFIEVDETDIALGNKLAVEILGKTLDELSIPARNLLELTGKMLDAKFAEIIGSGGKDSPELRRDMTFTRRELREFAGWTRTRTQKHLVELIGMEYVVIESGRRNGLQFYRLTYNGQGEDGTPFIPGVRMVR